ncbi:ComEA family DNA-binding protein [Achromobacter pestifer]|uniref:Helix-hairpin-helix DNA-binding motif class 1 domain-containing protein n=1 Tax=Achromobacter pestifer TaxID=1353889 RepID=A0A6S6ZDE5_9BURK|nr:DUF655 domain-containing protein [Achromobacter pestifer]CAB3672621.1 hypothetical protein LMG3431_03928 [Achromobacter pestifer]
MNPFLESKAVQVAACPPWRRLRHLRRPARTTCGQGAWRTLRQALGTLLVTAGLGVAAPPAHALDVNQATAQQLESVRGIGPRTAEIIVSERERGGKFDSFEDLAERVRGIGLKKAQALEAAGLQIGAGAAAAGKGAAANGAAANGAAGAKPAERKPAPPSSPSAAPAAALKAPARR